MPSWEISSDAKTASAKFKVQAELNPARMRQLTRDTGDFIVYASIGFLAQHTRTGNLARNMKRGPVERFDNIYKSRIGFGPTARYARWVEFGTGLHIDPKVGSPHLIYPKTATLMSWVEKGAFATPYSGSAIWNMQLRKGKSPKYRIFAHATKGQKPVYFLRDAFKMAESTYVPARLSQLAAEMTR